MIFRPKNRQKETFPIEDEWLHEGLRIAHQQWLNSERNFNEADDAILDELIYRNLLRKQIYRYYLRLIREKYGGGEKRWESS